MFSTDQILVDEEKNIVFSYVDSGPPSDSPVYETIILVHGNSFSNAIFNRLMPLKSEFNIRVVALSRRGFVGSTPFTSDERSVLDSDDVPEEAKAQFFERRGVEILRFINIYIQRSTIPAIQDSESGRTGGFALVGWSLGSAFTFAAVANVDSPLISDEMRTRLGTYLRVYVMLEAGITNIGASMPPECWIPLRDPNIPAATRGPLFAFLVTGYYDFNEETISTRDYRTALGTIVPSTSRIPSIFTFSEDERDEIITFTPESAPDLAFTKVLQSPLRKAYLKACYDKEYRSSEALRNMKVWALAGDRSYPFVWPALWMIEKDDTEAGGGESGKFVRFKMIPGANHFMHWDDPEMTMMAFKEIFDV